MTLGNWNGYKYNNYSLVIGYCNRNLYNQMILLPIATIPQLLQPGRWAVGRAPWKLWMSCLVLQHLRLRLERSVIPNNILFARQNIK